MAQAANVIDEALSLPRAQRAELAATLLRSLDDGTDEDPSDVEAEWADEIDRRIADRDAGRTGSVPLATALAAISGELAAGRDPENR